MASKPQLKPCPFCGGRRTATPVAMAHPRAMYMAWVKCLRRGCGALGPDRDAIDPSDRAAKRWARERARLAWNRRPPTRRTP